MVEWGEEVSGIYKKMKLKNIKIKESSSPLGKIDRPFLDFYLFSLVFALNFLWGFSKSSGNP